MSRRLYTIYVERRAWAEWFWRASDAGRLVDVGVAFTERGARRAAQRSIEKQERRRMSIAEHTYAPKGPR